MEMMLSRKWWMMMGRGVIAVVFGIAALVWPTITVRALVILLGLFFLLDGLIALTSVFTRGGKTDGSTGLLLEAVFGIGAAIVAFAWPGVTAVVIVYLIVFWAILTGITEIVLALKLRREIQGEWLLILAGALSVILGVALAFAPTAGVVVITWLIGIYAIVFGVTLTALGLRMKRLQSGV